MAGSDKSGEEMQSGRTNRAENRTRIWAQRNGGESFEGPAIFIVETAGDIEDDDFDKPADGQTIHGIMGSGNGAGAGVIGFTKRHLNDDPQEELSALDFKHAEGVGVFGKGITGVVGQGDTNGVNSSGLSEDEKPRIEAGAGVVGRGGAGHDPSAGVVGFSGGSTGDPKGYEVGVFGQGSTGVMGRGENGIGVAGFGDERAAGVVGFGGVGKDARGNDAQGTGVIGVGNNQNIFPPFDEPIGTGVLGVGLDGVIGSGSGGRGGIFQSERDAQVRLVPKKADEIKERLKFTPISPTFPALPRSGLRGDLMSVIDHLGQATLWFCVTRDSVSGTAQWAKVILGDLFDGTT
jgi:hypothetical protein